VGREGALDLEAAEFYVRSAVLALGAGVLERLLHEVGTGRRATPLHCCRGHRPVVMRSTGVCEKTLRTVLGPVRWARSRFVCPVCGAAAMAGDEALGVDGTGFSPGLRRLLTRAGSRQSFKEAAADLDVYGAIKVDAKDVERVAEATGRAIDDWMRTQASAAVLAAAEPAPPDQAPIPILYAELDGTGAPLRRSELKNVKGKAQGGRARTREAKLGAVFTQTTCDDQGQPIRDPNTTSYVGAIEESRDFGPRLYAEAVRRGLGRAQRVVVLSDGAEYNHSIAQEYFAHATHIIDLYHAAGHLADFIKNVTRQECNGPLHQTCYGLLEAGDIEALLERMGAALPQSGPRRREGRKIINYFARRKEQMRYAEFRRQGLFVGSGVIEAGCKTLIGQRLKQSGMFWSVRGANAIIAARCCFASGRFEQFWEDHAA
jgi:hypothetical protein